MKNRTRKKQLQAQRAGMPFRSKLTASVRAPGAMKGKIKIADDFDAPLPEVVQSTFDK